MKLKEVKTYSELEKWLRDRQDQATFKLSRADLRITKSTAWYGLLDRCDGQSFKKISEKIRKEVELDFHD